MRDDGQADCRRRRLVAASASLGGVGLMALTIPFVASLLPSEATKAAAAPIEVDVARLAPGQMLIVVWRGRPVWVVHRTPDMLATLPKLDPVLADPQSERKQQPDYCQNATRSIDPSLLVVVGICTHLGCSPNHRGKAGAVEGMPDDWLGGFLCPCHGAYFDYAGRAFANKPASINLEVPPHNYISETRILIGSEADKPYAG